MLELRQLTVRYGAVQALTEVSLRVEEGQFVVILGANGAGKSTLLRAVSGVVRPASGEILLDGKRVDGMAAEHIVRLGAAQVPEGRGIFPDLTVRENLLIGGYVRRDKAAVRRDYDAIMGSFPALAQRASQPGFTLSGGEQQMLAIGRALMSRPKLLLADEVSLGLAPLIIRQVFAELNRLKERGVTLLVVEQSANLVMKSADYAHVLKHGRVALAGTRDGLAASGALVAAYLGA